jgi:hypothetical protein
VLKEAFTHVASARVARAQDQDRCHDAEKVFAEKLVVETARTCSVPRAVQRIFTATVAGGGVVAGRLDFDNRLFFEPY